jgi:hypothetical protein
MGIVCYVMQTKPGQAWRSFKRGDTVEVEVALRARLGGGTYGLSVTIADRNVRTILATGVGEVTIYVAPRPGSMGWADLEATISSSGLDLSNHDDVILTPRSSTWQSLSGAERWLGDQPPGNEGPDDLVVSET